MASRTYELGELKVTVEAPTGELVDELSLTVSVHSKSALTDEQTIQAAGGLRAFAKVDATDSALHANMVAELDDGEEKLTQLYLFPFSREKPRANPYMEQLRRDQEAELAQETVPD